MANNNNQTGRDPWQTPGADPWAEAADWSACAPRADSAGAHRGGGGGGFKAATANVVEATAGPPKASTPAGKGADAAALTNRAAVHTPALRYGSKNNVGRIKSPNGAHLKLSTSRFVF